jgi:hypothetical protein
LEDILRCQDLVWPAYLLYKGRDADISAYAGELLSIEENDGSRDGEDAEMGRDICVRTNVNRYLFDFWKILVERCKKLGLQGVADVAVLAPEVEHETCFGLDEVLDVVESHLLPLFFVTDVTQNP